jgi:hypothetical protein
MENIIYYLPFAGLLGILFMIWKSAWVTKQEPGTPKMVNISRFIAKGAMAFLKAEYKFSRFLFWLLLFFCFLKEEVRKHPIVSQYSPSSRVQFFLGWQASSECVLQPRQMSEQPMQHGPPSIKP